MPLRTFFFLGYVSFFYRKMQGKRVLQEKSKFPAIISHVLKEIIKVRILAQYVFPKKFDKLILGQFFWHFFFYSIHYLNDAIKSGLTKTCIICITYIKET